MACSPVAISFPDVCGLPSVGNIASLRSYNIADIDPGDSLVVQGRVTIGDGLGGVYAWLAGSVATDDGVNVIKPSVLTALQAGRWVLVQRAISAADIDTAIANSRLAVRPETFMLGSDAGDGIGFQRMIDYMEARSLISVELGNALYDISDTPLQIFTPIQMIGQGHLEFGVEAGESTSGRAFTGLMSGTRIRSNCLSAPGITVAGGVSGGARFDHICFSQSHPTPGVGWEPVNYDWLFDIRDNFGRVDFGAVTLHGINKGMHFFNGGRHSIQSLRGQCFRQAVEYDDCKDVCRVDHMHLFTSWSASQPVMDFVQQNLSVITLGRMDGFFGGHLFAIAGRNGMRFVNNGYGFATKVGVDYAYFDLFKVGMAVETALCTATVGHFEHTGEQAGASGVGLPDSTGIYLDSTSGGGEFNFGTFRSDRTKAGAVRNFSNSSVSIDRPRWQNLGGAAPIISAGSPVLLGRREITDNTGLPTNEQQVLRQQNNRDSGLGTYADDTAAANGGVSVGGLYLKNGGAVAWRQA